MKRINLLLILLAIMPVFSCNDDPCNDITCLNDGICISGECDCLPGFEGDQCELFTKEKITGNFTVTSDCEGSNAETTEWAVAGSASNINEILITNFHKPAQTITVSILDSTTLEIIEQAVGNSAESFLISGTGAIETTGKFSLEYMLVSGLTSDTIYCSVDAIRQ